MTPISVRPFRSIIGLAIASSDLAIARIVSVAAVACFRVCERVARLKSANRSLSTTVRPAFRDARMRLATRSTRVMSTESIASGDLGDRPSAA